MIFWRVKPNQLLTKIHNKFSYQKKLTSRLYSPFAALPTILYLLFPGSGLSLSVPSPKSSFIHCTGPCWKLSSFNNFSSFCHSRKSNFSRTCGAGNSIRNREVSEFLDQLRALHFFFAWKCRRFQNFANHTSQLTWCSTLHVNIAVSPTAANVSFGASTIRCCNCWQVTSWNNNNSGQVCHRTIFLPEKQLWWTWKCVFAKRKAEKRDTQYWEQSLLKKYLELLVGNLTCRFLTHSFLFKMYFQNDFPIVLMLNHREEKKKRWKESWEVEKQNFCGIRNDDVVEARRKHRHTHTHVSHIAKS